MAEAQELAYVYDGSLEGLLTAIFTAYAKHTDPRDITTAKNLQPRLGQAIIEIESDEVLAYRVRQGICKQCGPIVFDAIKGTSLSDDPEVGGIIYRFVRYALSLSKGTTHSCAGCSRKDRCGCLATCSKKSNPVNNIAHPAVSPFIAANRAVYNERHKIMQFLRFEHMEGDVWFAQCNPNASVVPLIMDWFAGRFNTQAFMIYDENHHLAGVYEGRDWYLVKTEGVQLPNKSADEILMQKAWRRFYDTIAVEARYNPELRRQFMPKRLWKNITEMQETLGEDSAKSVRGIAPKTTGKFLE